MPFGLTNAPAQFQRIMDKVLFGLDGVMTYIDDLCIFCKDQISHAKHFEQVFDQLRTAGLKVKSSKCIALPNQK